MVKGKKATTSKKEATSKKEEAVAYYTSPAGEEYTKQQIFNLSGMFVFSLYFFLSFFLSFFLFSLLLLFLIVIYLLICLFVVCLLFPLFNNNIVTVDDFLGIIDGQKQTNCKANISKAKKNDYFELKKARCMEQVCNYDIISYSHIRPLLFPLFSFFYFIT